MNICELQCKGNGIRRKYFAEMHFTSLKAEAKLVVQLCSISSNPT
jgi:hypothetical protein